MCENRDVVILGGKVELKRLPNPSFLWDGRPGEDRELTFRRAYSIEHRDTDVGIRDCAYQVLGRRFTDLSCMMGEALQTFEENDAHLVELREHADGTRFILFYDDIPTFDSSDRVWDSHSLLAVYRDGNGIHMIDCRCGYRIPRIKLYIGLTKSIPAFDEWLEKLDCGQ